MAGLKDVKHLSKEALFGLSNMSDTAKSTLIGTAIAAGTFKAVDAISDYIGKSRDHKKFHGVIDYARDQHPELKNVSHDKMMNQMEAFYTLSPEAAVNHELGSSMLATTNDYGGTVDLATAKLVSDIGSRSSGTSEELLGFINTGRSVVKKDRE